jgi:nitrous oxidase accessory protein NosD
MSTGEVLTPNFNSNTTPSTVTTSGIVCFDMAKVEVINGSIKQFNHGIYSQDNSKILVNGTDLSNNRYDGINAMYSQIECIGVKSTTANGRYGYNLTNCIYYDGGNNTVTGVTAAKNGTAVAFTAV